MTHLNFLTGKYFIALVLALSSLSSTLCFANIDFSKIPPATTAQESEERFEARAQVVLDFWLTRPIGVLTRENNSVFNPAAIARVARGVKLNEVEAAILNPKSKPYALVGSDFRTLGPICRRVGDYDFALQGLVTLAYQIRKHPGSISPAAYSKLLHQLLTEKGVNHHVTFKIGWCGTHKDTENHILLSESSRYLTNQLLYEEGKQHGLDLVQYDNLKNGFDIWILERLQQIAKRDSEEYNSRPYQGIMYFALQNLYDYAESERVRIATKGLLDYLAAKYAIQTNLMRRLAPFGRQPKYATNNDINAGETTQPRFAILVGNYDLYALGTIGEPRMMLPAAVGTYRIPETILDLFFDKSTAGPYFQKYSHFAMEAYDAHDKYLVSAGGNYYNNKNDFGLMIQDGWAYPTTIMPTALQTNINDLIRIKGHILPILRSNTCIYPGFACGLGPTIPNSIPAACQEKVDRFTFIDFTAQNCPLKYGFYVAVYSKLCDNIQCLSGGKYFGFWETYDPRSGDKFSDFKQHVLEKNVLRKYRSTHENEYVTYDGHKIIFTPVTQGLFDWGIRQVDGKATQTNIHKWPLAEGDIVNADRTGLIEISNPKLKKTIQFDFRNPEQPTWTEN